MFKNASLKVRNSDVTPNHAATRIVRRLAGSLGSLDSRLSGRAMTARERTQAELADIRNSLARALLVR